MQGTSSTAGGHEVVLLAHGTTSVSMHPVWLPAVHSIGMTMHAVVLYAMVYMLYERYSTPPGYLYRPILWLSMLNALLWIAIP